MTRSPVPEPRTEQQIVREIRGRLFEAAWRLDDREWLDPKVVSQILDDVEREAALAQPQTTRESIERAYFAGYADGEAGNKENAEPYVQWAQPQAGAGLDALLVRCRSHIESIEESYLGDLRSTVAGAALLAEVDAALSARSPLGDTLTEYRQERAARSAAGEAPEDLSLADYRDQDGTDAGLPVYQGGRVIARYPTEAGS